LELIGCLNEEFARFAPEYITPAHKAIYRIYRDTRFSKDKTPYKTHISAIFPRHTALKREGAVFYFHFTEKEVLVFGGVYSPEREELLAYRTLLEQHYEEFRKIISGNKVKRQLGGLQGEKLTRTPKGFPVNHPAEELLRHRQWFLETTFGIDVLTSKKLVGELARHFEPMAPMIEFLNRPFAEKQQRKKMLMMAF
ncbi:MAG TPA: DUF2461 domain-containing protein, partial [Verrucomicrobiae bacterium]|nr:DUF2461 domain-containing protein [Verrucomicrobiae bacterium]